jgi:alpha-tubulin suppressor-like RCC1 family protein
VGAVSCGREHNAALTQPGEVVCCGINNDHQCDIPRDLKDVVAVACYGSHSMALTAEGKPVCWGDNRHGQCGAPENINVLMLNIHL